MEELRNKQANITVGELMDIRQLLVNLQSKTSKSLEDRQAQLEANKDNDAIIDAINDLLLSEQQRLIKTVEAIKSIENKIDDAV